MKTLKFYLGLTIIFFMLLFMACTKGIGPANTTVTISITDKNTGELVELEWLALRTSVFIGSAPLFEEDSISADYFYKFRAKKKKTYRLNISLMPPYTFSDTANFNGSEAHFELQNGADNEYILEAQ